MAGVVMMLGGAAIIVRGRTRQRRDRSDVEHVQRYQDRREGEHNLPTGDSDDRFRQFADSLPETLFECDVDGKLIYVNRSGLSTFRYEDSDLEAGVNILETLIPEDRATAQESIAEVLRGRKPKKSNYTAQRKDGSTFPISVRSTPIMCNGVPAGFRGIAVDRSDDEKTAEALRRSERNARLSETKFRSYIENAPIGVFVTDRHGKYVEVNETAARILGYTESELLSLSVPDSLHEDSFDDGLVHFQTVAREGRADGELKLKRKGGSPVWVSIHAVKLDDNRLMAFCLDIEGRRHNEEELRKLSHAVEQSPVSVVITDTKGAIEYVNPKFSQVTGYAFDDVRGRNPRILRSGETNGDEYKCMWETILGGRVWKGEFHNRRKNGELFWESVSISPLRDENERITHFVGIKEDITERKRAEEALRESEKRFRDLADSLPEMVFELDLGGMLTYMNRAGFDMFGYTPSEMTAGLPATSLVEESDRNRMTESAKKIAQGSASRWNEYSGLRKDGRIFPFAVHSAQLIRDGKTVGVRGILMNITERKRADEEIRRSQRFLQSVFDNIPDMIFVKDPRTFQYLRANKAAEALIGYSNKEIAGKDDYDIHPAPIAESFRAKDREALARKNTVEIMHQHLLTRRNQLRILQTKKIPILDDNLDPQYLLVISTDITDRMEHQQRMEELGRQLRQRNETLEKTLNDVKLMQNSLVQSEKMASIGQLTAGIAHEINNPLAFVSSNLNRFEEYFRDALTVLKEWQLLEPELQGHAGLAARIEALRAVERQADMEFITEDFGTLMRHTKDGTERIKSIVERLRGFSHMSDTGYVDANINTALDDSLTIVWNELKYKASIEKDFGELPIVSCNVGEIKQVFVNLMVNAAHAIETKGKITLRTRAEAQEAVIEISDTGCGIAPENLKRIFDPFFTTKAVGKGTGLGLWISATIIQKHGGTIVPESTPGKGTTFTVKLPVEPPRIKGGEA
jgi:PAS domain S-box-containing protein